MSEYICQECGGDHSEPHWLYADGIWRKENEALLAIIKDTSLPVSKRMLAYFAFCQEEGQRLQEKLYQMQKHQESQE